MDCPHNPTPVGHVTATVYEPPPALLWPQYLQPCDKEVHASGYLMPLSAISVNSLVFSGGDPLSEDDSIIADSLDRSQGGLCQGPSTPQVEQDKPSKQHVSIYVRVFEGE